jgi:hypothetical protein
MVSIYDKNFRAFPLTGEKIEVLQCKKMKFRNAGYAEIPVLVVTPEIFSWIGQVLRDFSILSN